MRIALPHIFCVGDSQPLFVLQIAQFLLFQFGCEAVEIERDDTTFFSFLNIKFL